MSKVQLNTIINDDLAGLRLDAALAKLYSQFSRSKLQQWIESGQVTIDHKIVLKSKERVYPGQVVEINAVIEDQKDWAPEEIPLDIVFEDESIIVINKPPGLVVHPGSGNPKSTLVNALLNHDAQLNKIPRAGLIHRLDKDTSGLLLIARTLEAHHFLFQQMQQRSIRRVYEAIVQGIVSKNGTIDQPIGRHPTQRLKMTVLEQGKHAITHYSVKERFRAHTYLEVRLETGRTHQIRVHMTYLNHPIVGDPLYGRRVAPPPNSLPALVTALAEFNRQALHAKEIAFLHPNSHEELRFEVPLPEDFERLLSLLNEDLDYKGS